MKLLKTAGAGGNQIFSLVSMPHHTGDKEHLPPQEDNKNCITECEGFIKSEQLANSEREEERAEPRTF